MAARVVSVDDADGRLPSSVIVPAANIPELPSLFAPAQDASVFASRNGVAAANTAAANTAALNALHTTALSLGLAIVLPAGTIPLTTLSAKAPMVGAGIGKTTLTTTGSVTIADNRVRVADLTISTTASTAISSANRTELTLERVHVDSTGATTPLALDAYNTDRLRVLNCRFSVSGVQLSLCGDFLLDGNYWDCNYANTHEPMHVSGQSSGQVVNNTVYRTATDGLDLYSSGRRCVVANNRFYGLRGAAGIECKVTMSDDSGNTSSPGNKLEATVITGNVLADFSATTTGTRVGIYAEYVDVRAAPAFAVAETNRAVIITNNVIEGMNEADPGSGVINSYWGIAYTGHNALIADNVISNLRAWQSSSPVGIRLAQPTGSKCVGVRVAGNIITGVEGEAGITVGTLDRCQIDGNMVRGIEENGVQTRWGVSIASGATLTECSIVNNMFECNYSTGYGVRAAATSAVLSKCRISGNVFRDCAISLGCSVQYCSFVDNIMDNGLNSQAWTVGLSGTSSRGNRYIGNHVTMSADYALSLTDHDGFVVTSSTFSNTARGLLLNGGTRNGVVDNNVSIGQASGSEFPHYSGVSGGDQATISVGTNKVIS